MKSKPEECKDCPLHNRPGPVKSFFTNTQFLVDVVFISHAPAHYSEYEHFHEPLKSAVERINLTSYGIVDCWKCVAGKFLGESEVNLYWYCMKILKAELICHQPKILVSIGTPAMEVLTCETYNAFKYPGVIGVAERFGDFLMMPMMVSSNPEFKRWEGAWDEGFIKLKEFLERKKWTTK